MACTTKDTISAFEIFPAECELTISVDVSKNEEPEWRAIGSGTVQRIGSDADTIFTGVLNFKTCENANNGL